MADNYVENFSFGEDDDEQTFQVKDPEAIEAEGGELANTIVTYDNEETNVQSFTDFISNFVSGTKVAKWFKDFKAGVEYILHVGSLVNNCVTNNSELPLSAAQGKVLMDEITSLKSDLTEFRTSLFSIEAYTYEFEDVVSSRKSFSVSGTKSGYTPIAYSLMHQWSAYYVMEADTYTMTSGTFRMTCYIVPLSTATTYYAPTCTITVVWLKDA